jgi:sodium/potassium-transporting ATPase subunit alpha
MIPPQCTVIRGG